MQTFLLLVLVQLSTGAYDTKMAPMESMEKCAAMMPDIVKQIPPMEDISYSLTCITVRATNGAAI